MNKKLKKILLRIIKELFWLAVFITILGLLSMTLLYQMKWWLPS